MCRLGLGLRLWLGGRGRGLGGVLVDFAESSVVEDACRSEAIVAVGVGDLTVGDFEQVVEDALEVVGCVADVLGGVTGEDRIDSGQLCCCHGN